MNWKEKFRMNRKKVVVCGSSFGQMYIQALQSLPDEFVLVGLYGKGSDRSKKCAETYHIPLYTDFNEIPQVDIACVIVSATTIGGCGTDMALQFLNKGVSVIQEQPIHPKDLTQCYKAAQKNKTYFLTSDLYTELPEVSRFIRIAKALNKKEPPLYIKGAFAPQVAYPTFDILSQALPSLYSLRIENTIENLGPFDIATGKIGNIPFAFEYNNRVFAEDRDNYSQLLHNFAFVYESGRLILEDTFGPVLWKPRMHMPKAMYNPENRKDMPAYACEKTMEIMNNFSAKSFEDVLLDDCKKAIGKNIQNLSRMIDEHANIGPMAQRAITYATRWAEFTTAMGFAKFITPDGHHYIPSDEIKKYCSEV